MPRQNRAYKRGEPHRDYTLFVIVCEGEVREKTYFEHFNEFRSQRVKVRTLPPVGHKSSPKDVLDRAVKYVDEFDLKDTDQLWMVMDTDRWEFADLQIINEQCEQNENWFLAISNPCFEIWLHAHVQDLADMTEQTCQTLKSTLHTKLSGGYNVKLFMRNLSKAIERAALVDNAAHFIPSPMTTQVHRLAKELIKLVGESKIS